jgi:uncharacterized membrane protein YeaQ/YmgE (transglycosylase-associated protein family)
MSILWTIIIGFIVGLIAKFIMPGNKYTDGFYSNDDFGNRGCVRRHLSGPSCRVV